mgnify:CR=1 FL=1
MVTRIKCGLNNSESQVNKPCLKCPDKKIKRPIKLSIKDNNLIKQDWCKICGSAVDPDSGPSLFMANSWSLVCDECGEKYAPDLLRLVKIHRLFVNDIVKGCKKEDDFDVNKIMF